MVWRETGRGTEPAFLGDEFGHDGFLLVRAGPIQPGSFPTDMQTKAAQKQGTWRTFREYFKPQSSPLSSALLFSSCIPSGIPVPPGSPTCHHIPTVHTYLPLHQPHHTRSALHQADLGSTLCCLHCMHNKVPTDLPTPALTYIHPDLISSSESEQRYPVQPQLQGSLIPAACICRGTDGRIGAGGMPRHACRMAFCFGLIPKCLVVGGVMLGLMCGFGY